MLFVLDLNTKCTRTSSLTIFAHAAAGIVSNNGGCMQKGEFNHTHPSKIAEMPKFSLFDEHDSRVLAVVAHV